VSGNPSGFSVGRRRWLGGLVSVLLVALLPLMGVRQALAAVSERPRAAFRARTLAEAMVALGLADAPPTGGLRLAAPAKAENGAVVPLKMAWEQSPRALTVLCAGNPVPLIARFELSPRLRGHLSTRIKMGQTADITVITEGHDSALGRADLPVEVTIGGCN